MEGAVCINEWLIRHGYLRLNEQPSARTRLTSDMVDWPNTKAWGEGGYYGRLFMNVAGREPQGCIPPGAYDAMRSEIAAGLEALGDEDERSIGTRCFRPEEVYREIFPACREPRFEPRRRWPRGSPCARPAADVRGRRGEQLELSVSFVANRRHLPIVEIRRAA